MKHVSTADQNLLLGDAAADLLLEYAALLAKIGSGDAVRMNAVDADGDAVVAGFLLNGGTTMLIQSTNSVLPEPDNAEAERYLRRRLATYAPHGEHRDG